MTALQAHGIDDSHSQAQSLPRVTVGAQGIYTSTGHGEGIAQPQWVALGIKAQLITSTLQGDTIAVAAQNLLQMTVAPAKLCSLDGPAKDCLPDTSCQKGERSDQGLQKVWNCLALKRTSGVSSLSSPSSKEHPFDSSKPNTFQLNVIYITDMKYKN